ncbi:MAG: sigma-70 family RNA polymerase sigma factor [Anaerolineae bacterium]
MATNDSELLQGAREFDNRALAEIYDRHAESIYRYLYRYLGNAHLAEDLTSEVFLKLLQALGTSRAPRDQLKGWLYRVAHNLAMDWFRQQAKGEALPLNEELVSDGISLATMVEEHEDQHRLRQAVRQLTPSQQQVILLRFGEGLKIKQVGQLMGKSEGSIKLIQYRAVKRLRKILEREKNGER